MASCNLLGWLVSWNSAFRSEYRGVVVADNKDEIVVFENDYAEEFPLPKSSRLVKIRPALEDYLQYHLARGGLCLNGIDFVDRELERLDSSDKVMALAIKALLQKNNNADKRSKVSELASTEENQDKVASRVNVSDVMSDGEGDDSDGDEEGANEEEDDDSSSSDNNDSSSDQDDEDNDDDDSSGEDSADDESEDASEDEDDSSEEDSDSDEDEDDEEIIEFKVVITHSKDVRGFAFPLESCFSSVMEQLEEYYDAYPKLFYLDDEGDRINILASSDFEYAVRSHKSTKKLRLTAEFFDKTTSQPLDAIGTTAASSGLQIQPAAAGLPTGTLRTGTLEISVTAAVQSTVPRGIRFAPTVTGHTSTGAGADTQEINELSTSRTHMYDRTDTPSELIWQKGELLGTGAFGQVYSGIDMTSGARIAVKEVALGAGKKGRVQAKSLQQEIRILSELVHPNIINYLGSEYSAGTIRIFLELATEGSIRDVLREFGPLSEPVIRRYTKDILAGLSFLHAKKFIHRDIKPSNLLVCNGVIKVADFGCSSSSFDAVAGHTSDVGHATVVGTTIYMAPEVMKSGESCNTSPENSPPKPPTDPAYDNHSHSLGASGTLRGSWGVSTLKDSLDRDNDGNVAVKLQDRDGNPPDGLSSMRTDSLTKAAASSKKDEGGVKLPNISRKESQSSTALASSLTGIRSKSGNASANGGEDVCEGEYNLPQPPALQVDFLRNPDGQPTKHVAGKEEDVAVGDASTLHKSKQRQKRDSMKIHRDPSKKGYGRRADIWSLGVSLCEMATAKPPYRTAAAAIYSVCVSKSFPTFPEDMSADAHKFLSRCLVEDPHDRASCAELQTHRFLMLQSSEDLRAPSARHTFSTVALLPTIGDNCMTSGTLRRNASRERGGKEGNDDTNIDDSQYLCSKSSFGSVGDVRQIYCREGAGDGINTFSGDMDDILLGLGAPPQPYGEEKYRNKLPLVADVSPGVSHHFPAIPCRTASRSQLDAKMAAIQEVDDETKSSSYRTEVRTSERNQACSTTGANYSVDRPQSARISQREYACTDAQKDQPNSSNGGAGSQTAREKLNTALLSRPEYSDAKCPGSSREMRLELDDSLTVNNNVLSRRPHTSAGRESKSSGRARDGDSSSEPSPMSDLTMQTMRITAQEVSVYEQQKDGRSEARKAILSSDASSSSNSSCYKSEMTDSLTATDSNTYDDDNVGRYSLDDNRCAESGSDERYSSRPKTASIAEEKSFRNSRPSTAPSSKSYKDV